MTNDGVFLNPDSGDIIATGRISAAQVSFPGVNDLLVNDIPFIWHISNQVSTTLSDYYQKSETSSSSEISSEFLTKLISSDVNLTYSSETKKIYLSAGANVSEVDCTDFIKDGMISSVQLCGNIMVFTFNTDAGTTPISVNLSSFVDNYSEQIQALSSAISTIGEDYLDSNDKLEIYNDLLSPDEVTLYKGPGNKDITLSVGTGTQLCTYTASLSDFYLISETSSASEISNALENTTKAYVGWNNKELECVNQLSLINITRDDYYNLADAGQLIQNVQYIISNDTYINWPSRISIDFLSSATQGQDAIVSCINNIISVFNHVNIDGNQLLRLVTIEKLSSETASQDDIVDTVNAILSAYKNKLEPYTVIEKGKLDNYYTKSETSSAVEISVALENLDQYVKENELSIYTLSTDNTVNLKVKDTVISAKIPEASTTILRVWNN